MKKQFGYAALLAGLLVMPVGAQSDGTGYTQVAGTVVQATDTQLTARLTDGTERTWTRSEWREVDTARGTWGAPVAWKAGDELQVFTKAGHVSALPIAAKLTGGVYGVDADYFRADGAGVNERLLINGLARTDVTDAGGKEMPKESALNNDLLVLYTIATASLPPQTVPDKVIVLSETAAQAAASTPMITAAAPAPKDVTDVLATDRDEAMPKLGDGVTADGATVYPVREILTKWGATIDWDAAADTVVIDWIGHQYRLSIPARTLTIDGQASYRVGRISLVDGVAHADRQVFAALWQLGQLDH